MAADPTSEAASEQWEYAKKGPRFKVPCDLSEPEGSDDEFVKAIGSGQRPVAYRALRLDEVDVKEDGTVMLSTKNAGGIATHAKGIIKLPVTHMKGTPLLRRRLRRRSFQRWYRRKLSGRIARNATWRNKRMCCASEG